MVDVFLSPYRLLRLVCKSSLVFYQKEILYRRPEGGGEDGMPLVETVSAANGGVCRAGSCTEDPQVWPLMSAKRTFVQITPKYGLPCL